MPAIQPALLKRQVALIAEHYGDPAAFVRSLAHLFDFYADYVQRPGYSAHARSLLQAYRVRPQVLRQIRLELSPLIQENPTQGLALCDALWEKPYLEFRLLAIELLGQLPSDLAEDVIERVRSWILPNTEARLVQAMLTHGLSRLRRERRQLLVNLVQEWLSSAQVSYVQFGLQALMSMIQDAEFENLPAFFRLLQPLTRSASPALRPYVREVLAVLARRSPQETALFLRLNADIPQNQNVLWLIRQVVSEFPPQMQESLRRLGRGEGVAANKM